MMKASGVAYSAGGASIYDGGASTRALAGSAGSYVAGGIPYEGDAALCAATTRKGEPCTAYAVGDTDFCVGHTKQVKKQQSEGA